MVRLLKMFPMPKSAFFRGQPYSFHVRQSFDSEVAPWKPANKEYDVGSIGLHDEVKDFFNYITPTPDEQFVREFVVSRVRDVVRNLWPECQIDVFGSFKTGLYLPTSDIDMVIFGKWDALPLHTLKQALFERGISSEIKVLDKATVPIVKMTDKETELRVDISFNMINSVHAAELIKAFMHTYPCLPYLVFVLKQFLLQRDMNEVWTGGLSSYALILMCVSFLQHTIPPEMSLDEINLGVLLVEFFELYGRHFNYLNTAIRVTNGGCYVQKEVVQQNMEPGLRPSILCIEDPLCPGNDVGRRSYCALQIKQAFEFAYAALSSAILPQYRFLHYNTMHRADVTILGRIIRISKKSIEFRQRIQNFARSLRSSNHRLFNSNDPLEKYGFPTHGSCTVWTSNPNPNFAHLVPVTVNPVSDQYLSIRKQQQPLPFIALNGGTAEFTAAPTLICPPDLNGIYSLGQVVQASINIPNDSTTVQNLKNNIDKPASRSSSDSPNRSRLPSPTSDSSDNPTINHVKNPTTEANGEHSLLADELASLTYSDTDGKCSTTDLKKVFGESPISTATGSCKSRQGRKRRCLRRFSPKTGEIVQQKSRESSQPPVTTTVVVVEPNLDMMNKITAKDSTIKNIPENSVKTFNNFRIHPNTESHSNHYTTGNSRSSLGQKRHALSTRRSKQ